MQQTKNEKKEIIKNELAYGGVEDYYILHTVNEVSPSVL